MSNTKLNKEELRKILEKNVGYTVYWIDKQEFGTWSEEKRQVYIEHRLTLNKTY